MREYGMPRFLWEGGAMGEGILRRIKPLINGLKSGWNVSAHKRYQTVMALEQVIGTFDEAISSNEVVDEDASAEVVDEDASPDEPTAVYKLYNYLKYGSIESVRESFDHDKPISGIVLDGNIVCIATNRGTLIWQVLFMPINCVRFGLVYHRISLSLECLAGHFRSKAVTTYCILLPLFSVVSNVETDKGMYSVITSDWRELSADFGLEYCRGVCLNDLVAKALS
mmetsp:Transcript_7291/g.10599  ORF Transcript_7291/g.10599 Transcript_7291/m.10599 type:complete len:225 (-) Transcript_7291:46-720(-)